MSDTCGCGCGHDHDDHVHEEMEMETLTLTLDDDTEMECGILGDLCFANTAANVKNNIFLPSTTLFGVPSAGAFSSTVISVLVREFGAN